MEYKIGLLVYVAGVFVTAIRMPHAVERELEDMAEAEREAVRESMSDSPVKARWGRERYERVHTERFSAKASWDWLTRLHLDAATSLVAGLFWPVMVLDWLWGVLSPAASRVWEFITGTTVICDHCERRSPRGRTVAAARRNAAAAGWVCRAQKDEDTCPKCIGLAPAVEG